MITANILEDLHRFHVLAHKSHYYTSYCQLGHLFASNFIEISSNLPLRSLFISNNASCVSKLRTPCFLLTTLFSLWEQYSFKDMLSINTQISAADLFFMVPQADASKSIHVCVFRPLVKFKVISMSENLCLKRRLISNLYRSHASYKVSSSCWKLYILLLEKKWSRNALFNWSQVVILAIGSALSRSFARPLRD